MAKNYSTPGIYLKETDISEVIAPVGTSVGVVVGKAKNGLSNARVLVNTDQDLIQNFGTPNGASTKDFGIYGALQYLVESDALYFTRVTDGTEDYANIYAPISTASGTYSAVSATTVDSWASSAYAALEANDDDTIQDLDAFSDAATSGGSLLISSIGPGIYGNNVGVQLITCASYSTQTSANSADWAWSYDDTESNGTPSSASDAVWKKVVKLNIFSRVKTTDAFPATPVETFYGTIGDVLAPDGTQLNIEQLVNGVSNYVYLNVVGTSFTSGITKQITTVTALTLGADSSAEMVVGRISNGWDFYSDKEKVSMNILMNTYFDSSNTNTINVKISSICNNRLDCIGTANVGTVTEFDASDLIDAGNTQSFTNPSRVAKYAGWSLIQDSYNDKKMLIPNSIFGAVLMARTDRIANTWNAPAGINRGILPVLGQNVKFNDAQIGNMYENNINAVKFIKGQGFVMWGQKTAQRKKSALQEIAVRRMILFVENTIEPSLLSFIFEPNSESTRLRIQTIIDNFLSSVKAGAGLSDYNVVVDDTNNSSQDTDNGVLNVDLFITPLRSVEFIRLQLIITRSGVNLTEVTV